MDDKIYTEFNSNKATLIRVDQALKMAATSSIRDDFESWYKALGILRREVIVKLKPDDEDYKQLNFLFKKLEKDLTIFMRSKNKSFINTKIDNDLDNFEILIRQIMNDKGMLLRDAERESGL